MSAPLPQAGSVNPYSLGYQKRQFGVGNLNPTPNRVFDDLVAPPTTGVTAEAVTPLEEQADVAAHPQTGIVPN